MMPGVRTILNAVDNASRTPITPAGIVSILKGEGGLPSHVRTVFGDVLLLALERVGAEAGVDSATILRSYEAAREAVAAANEELDAALREPW